MNDTPRTDAEQEIDNGDTKPLFEFCRQLERELAAVTAERDVLRGDLCTFAVDMERKLSLATATIANQHKLITDAEQRGEKKADEAWIARETQLMAEKDALLAEKANPETTWNDSVEINQLKSERAVWQEMLKDGTAVHINMLRGTIATPTKAQLLHVLADESLSTAEAERDALKAELAHYVEQGLIIKEDEAGL